MYKIRVRVDLCKSCGLCVKGCPKEIMILSEDLSPRGVHPAQCKSENLCIGCCNCAIMCPEGAIEVLEVTETKEGANG